MSRLLVGVGLAAMLAMPTLAQAQDSKVFFRPTVGGVMGAGPGASFSGLLSFKAGEKTQITGEIGRLANILPDSVMEEVELAAALAANTLGGKHSATASADANYGMVGFRRALRSISGTDTFFEFGVGMARVTSDHSVVLRGSATLQGDITSSVTTAFLSSTPETKPIVSLGGGLVLGVGRRTAVEIGARYMRIFTDAKAINMSNIFGGFRFGF